MSLLTKGAVKNIDELIYKIEMDYSNGRLQGIGAKQVAENALRWLKEAQRQGLTLKDIADWALANPNKDPLNISEILAAKPNPQPSDPS
jgi:hypothetical protein